jgi:valyl-tRNA synthetase
MLGLYATNKVPFKHVYMNGMVLDEKGQKMSKSKGNVINPIETISAYGSDALRLGLVVSRSAGQNQAFSLSKVIAARNFCNKLWNVARYIEDKLGDNFIPINPQAKTIADNWIISEVKNTSDNLDRLMSQFRFAEAVECIYHFVWDSVADWYIESSKKEDNLGLLAWVLENSLRLAHPFAPFVTETIWQTLPWKENLLISDSWPNLSLVEYNDIAAEEYTRLQGLVSEARYVTSELPGNKHYKILYQNDSLIEDNLELIKYLSKAIDIERVDQPRGLRLATSGREAWLDITEDEIRQHKSNLEKRLSDTTAYIENLEKRLNNNNYIDKAPEKLVDESREALKEKKILKEKLISELNVIK